MDLANLMDVQITSAGRKSQILSDVPAAVYVIHREKILDSGATSIAEALRLVPGLQVARINANRWAISSRGFNGSFANKLLVQIDGRSVYTPSYSGVYWDLQHVLLEDVERIEVIRGPGATLWGANAVNGIINIITLPASDTQGGLVSLGTGTHEKLMASARVGTKLNTDTYARFYAMGNDRNSFVKATDGSDGNDGWKNGQAGFRIDGDKGIRHTWTLQGDIFQVDSEQDVTPPLSPDNYSFVDSVKSHGGNILGRWTLKNSKHDIWTVQAYYDFNTRDEFSLDQTHHTFDMDFQNRFQPARSHDVVWGMGYRMVRDDFSNTFQVQMIPETQTTHLFSGFAQDEITIIDDLLWLTIGSKIEHNDYTGLEIQPNARILWRPVKRHSFWASVARAVRTPSRMEFSGKILQGISLNGNPEYDAEKLIALETGYRYAAGKNFSTDISLFYNRYTDLGGLVEGENPLGLDFANNMKGNTYGMEVAVTWLPVEWMETEFTYSYLQMDITGDEYSKKIIEETSPSHQAGLRLGIDLTKNLRLNLWARYTGKIKFVETINTDNYLHVIDDTVSLDANIRWRINDNIDLTVAGQNLLDGDFMEYGSDSYLTPIEIQRTLYAKITWRF
nr:TonB-dependent receptor [uncultured Desulfobacter sp.]